TCVLGCNMPPLRGCAASLSAPQWTSRSKAEVRIRARLFSGAVRPNEELEGAGWRARAPAPHDLTPASAPPHLALPADRARSGPRHLPPRPRPPPDPRVLP